MLKKSFVFKLLLNVSGISLTKSKILKTIRAVLISVVFSGVTFANAAKPIDTDVFSSRLYDHLSSDETLQLNDLVSQYTNDLNIFAFLAPPSSEFSLYQPGKTIFIPEKNLFSNDFLKNLISSDKSGDYCAFIWMYEDAASLGRDLVIENDYGIELARIAREKGYSPDWVVNKIYPELSLYPDAYQQYLKSIFDPARVIMRYTVIAGEKDLVNYVDQKTLDMQLSAMMQPAVMTKGVSAAEALSSLMFTSVEPQTNNTVCLTVGWPDSGLNTNELEIFICDDLGDQNWSVAETVTINLTTNRYEWVDDDGYTNRSSRFYHCFTLEDDDFDGVSNGREKLIYKTDPLDYDTDGDALYDGWELVYLMNPLDSSNAMSDPDNDGFGNLEEQRNGTSPAVPNPGAGNGAVAAVRYYYDDDDRLTDCYIGTASAETYAPSPAHNLDETYSIK